MRRHVARPRRDTIALTIPKNAIWIGSMAAAGFGLLLFFVGMWVGRGTAEAPAPVSAEVAAAPLEEILEESDSEVTEEVTGGEPAEETAEEIAEASTPPPDRSERPKLDIRERMPRGKHGMQVGAFESKREARAFLEKHATDLAGMPMYVLPAKGSRGVRYRVRVGAFEDREAAEKARIALPPDLAKGSMVVKY
jgi:cell division septation protein DedD